MVGLVDDSLEPWPGSRAWNSSLERVSVIRLVIELVIGSLEPNSPVIELGCYHGLVYNLGIKHQLFRLLAIDLGLNPIFLVGLHPCEDLLAYFLAFKIFMLRRELVSIEKIF